MAIWLHQAAAFTLLFIWLLASKAKTVSAISDNKIEKEYFADGSKYLTSEDATPSFSFNRPFRSIKKIILPRTTRIGENLFTARGYGKRSSKTEMALLSARRFGKRNKKEINSFLCIITRCKNYSKILNIDEDVVSVLERRDKEFPPRETAPEEDCD